MGLVSRIIRRFASKSDQALIDAGADPLALARIVARIHLRHLWLYFAALTASAVFFAASGMDVYHRTEAPQFCASCHEMGGNLRSWQVSAHKDIVCIDCHAREGILGYVQAKLGGTRQLFHHLTAESIGDIRLGDGDREIVTANCIRCHAEASRLEERGHVVIQHKVHIDKGVSCVACHSAKFAHPEPPPAGHPATEVVYASHEDCFKCHDGTKEIAGTVVFDARKEGSCEKCHPDSKAVWDHGGKPWKDEDRKCLSCHDTEAGEKHFALRGDDEAKLCKSCHEQILVEHTSKHAPFAKGECSACHKVMSPLHLFKSGPRPTVDFCVSCHEEMGTRLKSKTPPEAPPLFVAEGKDLHKKHGKLFDEDPEWCKTCHAGHGSPSERAMLQLRNDEGEVAGTWTAAERGGTCAGPCHEDPIEYEWAEGASRKQAGETKAK